MWMNLHNFIFSVFDEDKSLLFHEDQPYKSKQSWPANQRYNEHNRTQQLQLLNIYL